MFTFVRLLFLHRFFPIGFKVGTWLHRHQELRLVPDLRRRTDSECSETDGAVELWTELQKIREDLMKVA